MADEWRLCVDWLVQCRILPQDHKATQPEAQAFDLAQTLRDGVLLCHLLNSLKPYSVDPKDFSPRPQLSQFLCLKNIRAFLSTCEKVFKIDNRDLFEPPDLFDVKNFRKVLHTLSKLSKTDYALKDGRRAFAANSNNIVHHEYYNSLKNLAQGFPPHNDHDDEPEEDIYGNLSNMAIDHGIEDQEELYDTVYQEEDEIYEDLVSTMQNKTKRRRPPTLQDSQLPSPVTKRDYCIKEMCDTEKNYVSALEMITNDFIKKLNGTISKQDQESIFLNIEQMLVVHKEFYDELYQACLRNKPKIHEVFVKWKKNFLIYGEYCSNLPKAQECIEELLKKNDAVREKIEECERQANEARFRLRDLLHVPMQRVLKYHLLLRELIKNTDKNHEDVFYLQQALEDMQDLSLYVNEVKRDNENIALILEIQNSIVDLQMPPNTTLKDYGRLQKDGELKVRSHIDNRIRQRYIFLFDKVMLMAKTRGDTYSFKEAIVLAEYKVDSAAALRDGLRRGDRSTFQMVKCDDAMAYTFLAKTDDIKEKWIDAIKLALDNTQPAAGRNYIMTTFDTPKVCDICGKLLRGVFFQGYKSPTNNLCVHKECIGKTKQVPRPNPPQRPDKYRATVDYNDAPRPGAGRRPLKMTKGDQITVLQQDGDWWRGSCDGQEGWFPSQLVELQQGKNLPRRQPSYIPWKPPGGNNSPGVKTRPASVSSPPPCQFNQGPGYVNVEDLSSFDWYVGKQSRDAAGIMLKSLPDGAFLVRHSENPQRRGDPALSIKYAGNVRHIKIENDKQNGFYMSDTRYFHTLPDLVQYYQQNSLSDSFPEVQTSLTYPYKSAVNNPPTANGHSHRVALPPKPEHSANGARVLSYAKAQYDYAATAMTQINLKAGDRVAVLSKTGSDKGWWKGEHCTTKRIGYFPFAYVKEEDDD